MNFPPDFYHYLATHNHTGIKGGLERETFLDIWIVQVAGRVYARSWGKSQRSWFTEFLARGIGQIRYGERVLTVRGKQLPADSPLHAAIDQAYRDRYTEPVNLPYVAGITQLEYAAYTMEFEVRGVGGEGTEVR